MPYTTLIQPENLKVILADCVVIDCRFSLDDFDQGRTLYTQGHIPGACFADLNKDLSSAITKTSGRHPLPDFDTFAAKMRSFGINNTTQIVVYDDANGGFAARAWWLLRALGHEAVAVLEGGIQAWQAADGKLDTELPEARKGNFSLQADKSAWWDIDELQTHLKARDCVLIDARTKERFDGLEEPIDPIAGHIPGSVNLPVTDNVDETGAFLKPEILRKRYSRLIGNTNTEQVVHSCGSGVFACYGVLAMEIAGLSGSKIYPGSWSEWIRDPNRPIEP